MKQYMWAGFSYEKDIKNVIHKSWLGREKLGVAQWITAAQCEAVEGAADLHTHHAVRTHAPPTELLS